MPRGPHMSHHLKSRHCNPKYRARNNRLLQRIRPLATKWHKSKAGSRWHSQHTKEMWTNGSLRKKWAICTECGKRYLSHHANYREPHLCSLRCLNKRARRRSKDLWVRCVVCRKQFVTFRYTPADTCSYRCRAVLSYRGRS
jgi:hypothetical protein